MDIPRINLFAEEVTYAATKASSVVDARLRRWTSFWPQKRAETLGADYGGCEGGLFRRSSLQSARTFHWLPSLSLAVHRQKVRSSFAPPLRSCELVPLHSKVEKNESKRQQERRLHDCIAHIPVRTYIDSCRQQQQQQRHRKIFGITIYPPQGFSDEARRQTVQP